MLVGLVAVVQQHDGVDHEDHHRAHVDQHLEQRHHVHGQRGVDGGQAEHVRHQRECRAHGLAQRQHQAGEAQCGQAEEDDEEMGHACGPLSCGAAG